MIPALVHKPVDAPIHQRRAHKRFDYEALCEIQREAFALQAQVKNISEGGLNLTLLETGTMPVGKVVTITIGTFAPIKAVIRWQQDSSYGVQFLSAIENNADLHSVVRNLEDWHATS